MKIKPKNRLLPMLIMGALAVIVPRWAMASTAPCTQISNQASIDYEVGGINQTDVLSDGDTGTAGIQATTFNVGVKVIVAVTNQDGANVTVTPGTTKSVLKFRIDNDGNTAHDYTLAAEAAATTTASPYSGTDSFDPAVGKAKLYVDSNANDTYDDGVDTETSTIDDLAADTGYKYAFIVYTPDTLTEANGAVAVYYLKATTKWANGTDLPAFTDGNASYTPSTAQVSSCNGTKTIDVVAKKSGEDGPATGDSTGDAIHSDDSAYQVSTANISVTKSMAVYSDPINGTSSPKAIPGAIVTYTITIANSGGQSATSVSVTDSLNTEITNSRLAFTTQYNDGTTSCSSGYGIVVDDDAGGANAPACKTNSNIDDGTIDADWSVTGTNTVTVTGMAVAASSSATIKFQATIQ